MVVSLASHVHHDVKSQVTSSHIKSHQVTKSKRPFFWLEVSIQHQKAATLRRGPGCLRQPFCPLGGRISQLRWAPWIVVSTRSGGLGRSLPRLAVSLWLGCWGLSPRIVQTCSNTWVQDELKMSQILYQTISRGISSVMFVHHLCLYRNAPQASPGISKEPGENGVSSGAKIIPIPFSKEMRDKFEGGVMGSDGCIYCIPLRLSSTAVSSWPSRPQSPMELWFVPSLSRSWQKHANIAHHYTQTPRFALAAQNSANTREICTTSNNGRDFMFNYVARVLTSVASTCII